MGVENLSIFTTQDPRLSHRPVPLKGSWDKLSQNSKRSIVGYELADKAKSDRMWKIPCLKELSHHCETS